ncbi:FGGY-family carbohydrate kinase [Arthrobacter sp. SD76]|uniref:FGGY-family carbohydrate kinase n=1 Tax=Arthrobacter sp. SD76 TaxID=3415007 RepID=UPI003C77EE49
MCRATRIRGTGSRIVELGHRNHPRHQGRDAGTAPRPRRSRLLAPGPRRGLASGRSVRNRSRIPGAAATRSRPECVIRGPPGTYPEQEHCLPAGVGAGREVPLRCTQAEAFILDQEQDQDDAGLYAAAVQGISFIERLSFDHLHRLGAAMDGPLVLTGGAARSREWSQLRADILARPVTLVENAEPALGMAILAASAELGPLPATAEAMVHVQEVIDPRPQATATFMETYLRLIQELHSRGWLGDGLAAHAAHNTQKVFTA